MRGRVAKALRRKARALTAGVPERLYQPDPGRKVIGPDGRAYVGFSPLKLEKFCTRSVYHELKRYLEATHGHR